MVFIGLTPNHLSLRDQSADWSWQSPGPMEPGNDYHQKSQEFPFFGCFSVHLPSNRGIATPVCALVRNDSIFERAPTNTNFPFPCLYGSAPVRMCGENTCIFMENSISYTHSNFNCTKKPRIPPDFPTFCAIGKDSGGRYAVPFHAKPIAYRR